LGAVHRRLGVPGQPGLYSKKFQNTKQQQKNLFIQKKKKKILQEFLPKRKANSVTNNYFQNAN
jgi:inosine/xanthosine triphosphate pyrophosphatase family protein